MVAEVIQNGTSAASRSIGIVEYLVKLLPSVSLQCFNLRRGKHSVVLPDLVDEKFLRIAIARTAIQDALRGPTVASSAARLLVVGFQAGGNVVVDHKADVSLVDSHAKGVGRHHHRIRVGHEVFLALFAGLSIHASVIGAHGTLGTALLTQCRQLLHQPACRAVDDATARLLRETTQQGLILLTLRVYAAAGIGEIGAIKACDVYLWRPQLEHFDNVVTDVGSGRRGQRHGNRRSQLLAHLGQAHVFGTEVVPPEAETCLLYTSPSPRDG